MPKMVIIADDLTGALDTGACLLPDPVTIATNRESARRILSRASSPFVSINAETRHLGPEEAAAVVGGLVAAAVEAGAECVYKKTDSALRGNVGAELTAALVTMGEKRLHFLPAYPTMGRLTVGGIQYVDGAPVSESAFGKDPFEPVVESSVARLIARQSSVGVREVPVGEAMPRDFEGIVVYDALTEQDVTARVREINDAGELASIAGCAAGARAISEVLGGTTGREAPRVSGNVLVVCGSVNGVSVEQCACAKERGAAVFKLPVAAKFDPGWLDSAAGDELVSSIARSWSANPLTVVDGTGREVPPGLAREGAQALAQARGLVAGNIGRLATRIGERGAGPMLVSGGDVLSSFLSCAGIDEVRPRGLLCEGIVGFDLCIGTNHLVVASKSGGFGSRELYVDMAGLPARNEMECETC